jgi:hypothetical protein
MSIILTKYDGTLSLFYRSALPRRTIGRKVYALVRRAAVILGSVEVIYLHAPSILFSIRVGQV